MKAVVLGDVGWRSQYHVGDEAMTEVALDQLRARGFNDLTVVAGETEVAAAMYDCAAELRIGYHRPWSRERLESVRSDLEHALTGGAMGSERMRALIAAIRGADAAVIAGGGNLNSAHAYHLYERWSFARIARHLEVPLFVVSQTVGPWLEPADEELVGEILDGAAFFGARDAATAALLSDLRPGSNVIRRTMDDAVLLRRSSAAFPVAGTRYVVASFADEQPAQELGKVAYPQALAQVLDAVAVRNDVTVVLLPHVGSLEEGVIKADDALNQRIVAESSSARIVAVGTCTARDALALTEGALASVSTRYHQAVFSMMAGIPSLTLARSDYDVVRMAGAYENAGLTGYVLPALALRDGAIAELIGDLIREGGFQADDLRKAMRQRSSGQEQVWDAIVDAIRTGTPVRATSFPSLDVAGPLWTKLVTTGLAASRLLWTSRVQEETARAAFAAALEADRTVMDELRNALAYAEERREAAEIQLDAARTAQQDGEDSIRRLKAAAAELERSLHAARNRRAARIANRLSRLIRIPRRLWRRSGSADSKSADHE